MINVVLVLCSFQSLREDRTVMGRWPVTPAGHRVRKGICRVGGQCFGSGTARPLVYTSQQRRSTSLLPQKMNKTVYELHYLPSYCQSN